MNISTRKLFTNAMIATPIIASLPFIEGKITQAIEKTQVDIENFEKHREAESNYQKAMMIIREEEIKDSIESLDDSFDNFSNTKYQTVKELRERIENEISMPESELNSNLPIGNYYQALGLSYSIPFSFNAAINLSAQAF